MDRENNDDEMNDNNAQNEKNCVYVLVCNVRDKYWRRRRKQIT